MHAVLQEKQKTKPIIEAKKDKCALLVYEDLDLPGSSFFVNISVSVKLGCGDASDDSQDEPCIEVGGATSVDDLVTTSFKILSASFQ